MEAIAVLLAGFLAIGMFSRKFDGRSRLLMLLLAASVIVVSTVMIK